MSEALRKGLSAGLARGRKMFNTISEYAEKSNLDDGGELEAITEGIENAANDPLIVQEQINLSKKLMDKHILVRQEQQERLQRATAERDSEEIKAARADLNAAQKEYEREWGIWRQLQKELARVKLVQNEDTYPHDILNIKSEGLRRGRNLFR